MATPIRLLCCSSTMDGGGSERQLVNMLKGLDRTKVVPELFLLNKTGVLLDEVPSDTAITSYWQEHQRSRLYFPGRVSASQSNSLRKTIRKHRCDVVYDRLFHMALIAGRATRLAGVARVATIVSPPEQDLLRTESRFVWLKRWVLAKSYASATRLLAVSQGTAENAAKFYNIPISRFEVILSPIDLERVERLQSEDWKLTPNRQDRLCIVSIGRLSEEKGHDTLLKAVSLCTRQTSLNIDLHLVGDGPLKSNLQEHARFEGIADQVFFHGQVANPFPLLKQADLFCLPSHYEGLPNALLEAMALGVPAIASNCPGGIREVTLNGSLVELVTRGDPIAWSRAIQKRFESPETSLGRVEAARRHVLESHSLPKWIRVMEQIFIEASGGR